MVNLSSDPSDPEDRPVVYRPVRHAEDVRRVAMLVLAAALVLLGWLVAAYVVAEWVRAW